MRVVVFLCILAAVPLATARPVYDVEGTLQFLTSRLTGEVKATGTAYALQSTSQGEPATLDVRAERAVVEVHENAETLATAGLRVSEAAPESEYHLTHLSTQAHVIGQDAVVGVFDLPGGQRPAVRLDTSCLQAGAHDDSPVVMQHQAYGDEYWTEQWGGTMSAEPRGAVHAKVCTPSSLHLEGDFAVSFWTWRVIGQGHRGDDDHYTFQYDSGRQAEGAIYVLRQVFLYAWNATLALGASHIEVYARDWTASLDGALQGDAADGVLTIAGNRLAHTGAVELQGSLDTRLNVASERLEIQLAGQIRDYQTPSQDLNAVLPHNAGPSYLAPGLAAGTVLLLGAMGLALRPWRGGREWYNDAQIHARDGALLRARLAAFMARLKSRGNGVLETAPAHLLALQGRHRRALRILSRAQARFQEPRQLAANAYEAARQAALADLPHEAGRWLAEAALFDPKLLGRAAGDDAFSWVRLDAAFKLHVQRAATGGLLQP